MAIINPMKTKFGWICNLHEKKASLVVEMKSYI